MHNCLPTQLENRTTQLCKRQAHQLLAASPKLLGRRSRWRRRSATRRRTTSATPGSSPRASFIEDKNAALPIDAAIQSNLRETAARMLASLTPRNERVAHILRQRGRAVFRAAADRRVETRKAMASYAVSASTPTRRAMMLAKAANQRVSERDRACWNEILRRWRRERDWEPTFSRFACPHCPDSGLAHAPDPHDIVTITGRSCEP